MTDDDVSSDPGHSSLARMQALAASSGPAFLELAAAWLREELQVLCVSIGEIGGDAADSVIVHALATTRPDLTCAEYTLAGTPCQDVLHGGRCVLVANSARALFPDDALFSAMSVESYTGMPLSDGFGRIIGLVCAFDTRPITQEARVQNVIESLRPRIAAELAQVRTLRNMATSLKWMRERGDDLTVQLVAHLREVAQVSTTFLAEWLDDGRRFRIVALNHRGRSVPECDGMLCNFAEMPCNALRQAPLHEEGQDLRQRYTHPLLVRLEADAYAAFRIDDGAGRPLGHLALMHHRPLLSSAVAHSPAVALFAARAGAELAARRSDQRRSEAEAALVASQKLESIGLMAGAIAHDFNNLLVTILGSAGLALDELPDASAAREHVTRIEVAATRAGRIVGRLLDYAGRRPTAPALVDVSELVRESVELVPLARHRNASLALHLGTRVPSVLADATQLQQVIVNLVLNAAEALAGNHGHIRVATRRATLGEQRLRRLLHGSALTPGPCVLLEVSDDGCGMDAATLARVFDPFFTSKAGGRGLGMATVQGVARGHGAGLEVRSRVGVGTTIRLYFPLPPSVPEAAAAPAQADTNSPPSLRDTILVIDDEPAVGAITGQMLSALGYRVEVCGSGEAAADRATSAPHGAAFIDLRMPGLDGWQTLARLRAIQPALPAVMVSGYSSDADIADLLDANGVTFVAKPFRQSDLAGALARALSRSVAH